MKTALLSLLLLCASFPPVPYHWDSYISPKWYATGMAVVIILLYVVMGLAETDRRLLRECWNRASLLSLGVLLLVNMCYFAQSFSLRNNPASPWPYDNPSGLAFAICVLNIPAMRAIRKHRYAMGTVFVLAFIIVFLTKSRTGLIVMSLFVMFFTLRHIHGKTVRVSVTVLLLSCLVFFVVIRKQDSSSGRCFILRTTLSLIMERPIAGHGLNGFQREYMDRQGKYFASHPDSSYSMLADEVCHPLNEYLMAWTNGGIIGMVLLLTLTIIPIIHYVRGKKWVDALEAVPLPLFCFLSYPLNYPLAWIILSVSLLGITESGRTAKWLFYVCSIVMTAYPMRLLMMENGVVDSGEIIYNKAAKAYRKGLFEDAMDLISKCRGMMSGYNLELLSGDICRHLKRNEDAVNHYKTAANMCPCRFAPLEGLFCIYKSESDSINARTAAEQIVSKPVKVTNSCTTRIKLDAREYLKQYHIK